MTIKLNNAKCTGLELQAPVELAKEESGGDFEIKAYTGAVVDRWWGKLAIEVSGIKSKVQMPILLGHDTSKIVGYSISTRRGEDFRVVGKFSSVTDEAKRVKGLADEGFPWQASIGVRPIKVLSLEEKAETTVNGKKLKGPAEVWLESEVVETSFVPLGADDRTSVSRFSKFEEVQAPTGAEHTTHEEELNMEITMEVLEKDAPELLASIKADGATQERERIKAVLEQAMPGHDDLINRLAFDGKTTGPEAAVQVLTAERAVRITAAQNLADDAIKPVSQPHAPEPAPKGDPKNAEEFNNRTDLVEEFGDYDTYKAYLDASGAGKVKILGKAGK